MKFHETAVDGAFLIDIEPISDERGGFARMFCEKEFEAMGLESRFAQINTSWSVHAGTLRGLHYQVGPAEEVKLVRCIRGEVYDVVLDLRKDSPTFGTAAGARLSDSNRQMMYAPTGCAHGFLTLVAGAEVIYPVSNAYRPDCERGVRWDDPYFRIDWPVQPTHVSNKDRQWPDYLPDDGTDPSMTR